MICYTKYINENNKETNKTKESSWISSQELNAFQISNKQFTNKETQTYGMFYTSSKGLESRNENIEKNNLVVEKNGITSISAGRGYWRQQMDHICTHLKSFAHNNPEFRILIAEPKLGKVI